MFARPAAGQMVTGAGEGSGAALGAGVAKIHPIPTALHSPLVCVKLCTKLLLNMNLIRFQN